MYMEERQYSELKTMGVEFQLNLTSLTGAYGPEAKAKAEYLLRNGMYNFSGTDLHRAESRQHFLDSKIKKKLLGLVP
ncbi:MAG: capsular biosynthesis protein, partial [Bacteroidales bacterium]|nr:capsular biosynthesis protein [Bacteroidales bacterium]